MIWSGRTIKLLCAAALVCSVSKTNGQSYTGSKLKVGIYSSTPLEDIRAVSEKGVAAVVVKTRAVVVQVPVKTLEFDRKLMQEHFNENYMESDKYPYTKFKGIIDPSVDLGKDGEYTLNVSGILSVHGVDQQRSIPCKISIKEGVLTVDTQFKVACADHNITIPRLVFAKIAETITIKVSGQLSVVK